MTQVTFALLFVPTLVHIFCRVMADPSNMEGTILKAMLNIAGGYELSLVINGQDGPQPSNSLLVIKLAPPECIKFLCNGNGHDVLLD